MSDQEKLELMILGGPEHLSIPRGCVCHQQHGPRNLGIHLCLHDIHVVEGVQGIGLPVPVAKPQAIAKKEDNMSFMQSRKSFHAT